MKFEWDQDKNRINAKKHGLRFEESIEVFADPNAIEIFDEDHSSKSEDRYKVIGLIQSKIIIVSLIFTESDEVIRVISARKANKEELKAYEKKR